MVEFDFIQSLPAVIPELGLTLLAIIVLGLDLYLPEERRKDVAYVAAIGMGLIAITPMLFTPSNELMWGGMVRDDILAQIFKVMIILAGAITALMGVGDHGVRNRGEFHLIIIIATLGGTMLSASADLIMVFVALETISIPLYMLASFNQDDPASVESGLKYFLFGSFASGIMLYGFSLLYGFSGQTNLYEIANFLTVNLPADNALPVLGTLVLIMVGFGFKISAVPFHFWTPDVYQGAPTPVTAFISVASKAASFAVLARVLIAVFPDTVMIAGQSVQDFWVNMIVAMSIITMTLGNVLALRQSNIKRLLAYSSIAQAGYTLVGIAAIQHGTSLSVASVAFYMFMYTFTNLLAFSVIILFTESTNSEEIKDLAGLQRRNPWLALAMTIGLLSLAGIPPAAGFFGKFFLFQAAIEAELVGLAIIGVLNAIIALYYYLVVIKIMYVDRNEEHEKNPITIRRPYTYVLAITATVVILLGVLATPVFDWAVDGAKSVVNSTTEVVSGS